ncbi:hypothetical protein SISNIDRAFT_458048, partial [Sistotremastrum niveocremeum HHB9708]
RISEAILADFDLLRETHGRLWVTFELIGVPTESTMWPSRKISISSISTSSFKDTQRIDLKRGPECGLRATLSALRTRECAREYGERDFTVTSGVFSSKRFESGSSQTAPHSFRRAILYKVKTGWSLCQPIEPPYNDLHLGPWAEQQTSCLQSLIMPRDPFDRILEAHMVQPVSTILHPVDP